MTSILPIEQDQQFQEESAAATDMVDAHSLDSQFTSFKARFNDLLDVLALTIRDDDTLADGVVRLRNLHAEVLLTMAATAAWQPKVAVRVATTTAGTLSSSFENGDTVDGVVLSTNDRILLKNQADASQNGIYTVNISGAPTRSTDADEGTELDFASVFVTAGTVNSGNGYVSTSDGYDIGTSDISFSQTYGIPLVPITRGGTGAITAAAARAALGPWNDVVEPLVAGSPITSGIGTEERILQDVTGDFLSVLDFGATGDGVTDDTAAIALAFATIPQITGYAQAGTAAKKKIWFPAGIYVVTSTITIPPYSDVQGERAIIKPDPGVTAFTTAAYQLRMEGVMIIGGAKALTIASGNVDTSTIHLNCCEFQDQTTSAISSDGGSASTLLTLKNTRMYNVLPGAIGIDIIAIDRIILENCWVTWAGIFADVGDATHHAVLNIKGLFATPTGGSTVWFRNYGYISAIQSRFGGEAGAILCKNYGKVDDTMGDVKGLCFDDCEVFTGGNYSIEFYETPNVFTWNKIRGNADIGFYFDAGAAALTKISAYNGFSKLENNARQDYHMSGNAEAAARMNTISSAVSNPVTTLKVADKVLQISNDGTTQYGYVGSLSGATTSSFTHTFGASVRGWTGSSSSYVGTVSEQFATAFNGFTSGVYTAVYDIEVTGDMPVAVLLQCADNRESRLLPTGKHIVCIHGYYNSSTSAQTVGYSLSRLNNAMVIGLGPIKIFSGKVDIHSQNNILYGTVTPSTLRWELGDTILSNAPTLGGSAGRLCTVAGTPGTWTPFGAAYLEGSTTYNPASLIDGAGATTTVTVTGAILGQYVKVSFSLDLQGILLTGWVSSSDTVSVRFQNETTGTIDLGSGTLRARVEAY